MAVYCWRLKGHQKIYDKRSDSDNGKDHSTTISVSIFSRVFMGVWVPEINPKCFCFCTEMFLLFNDEF